MTSKKKGEKAMKKQEALKRMEILKLSKEVRDAFEQKQQLYLSTAAGAMPMNNPEWVKLIKKIEKEYGILVYHTIFHTTMFGVHLVLMYVGSEEDEWEIERDGIEKGYTYAYVENLYEPDYSEFGSIRVLPYKNGLLRTE